MPEASASLVDFLIVGCQRSGTTVTREAVLGHPQVSMIREELAVDPFFSKGFSAFTHGRESYTERRAANRAMFRALTRLYARPATRAAGVKLAVRLPDDAVTLRNSLLEFFGDVRIVHVVRRDLVAQFASLQRAFRTGVWDDFGGRSALAPAVADDGRLTLSEEGFAAYCRDVMAIRAQMASLADHAEVLTLHYEDDIHIDVPAWPKLFEFLGIDVLPTPWMRMRKVAPPVEEFVSNVAALREIETAVRPPASDEVLALALDAFESGTETDSIEVLAQRAQALARAGWLEGARAACRAASLRTPRSGFPREQKDAFLAAVVARSARSGDDPAVPLQERAATLEEVLAPLSDLWAVLFADLAAIALDLGDALAADAACVIGLRDAKGAAPARERLYLLLAQALETHQDGDRADDVLERLAERCAREASYWLLRGRCANYRGDDSQAARFVGRAAELDPTHPWLSETV